MLKRAEKRDLKIYPDSKDTAGVCKRTRSRSFDVSEIGVDLCFFCGHPGGSAELHEASTLELDRRVRKSAAIIEDTRLLGKLSNGDMIALECKYHAKCLAALYNKEREAENVAPVFKLYDRAHLYNARMEQFGVQMNQRTHTTRLKQRILAHFPGMRAQNIGRDVFLILKKT